MIMDKYQKFVFEHIAVCISVNEELSFNCKLTDLINSDGEFEVKQNENYNIKKHFIYFKDNGEQLASIKVDGKTTKPVEIDGKKYARAEVDFDNPAKEIRFEFADGICEPLTCKLKFIEVDHGIYDSKVQAEINASINPEHNTGVDLVNIYWNLVSDKVVESQVNLYFVSRTGERVIGKYKETEISFKSVTGLAFGKYCYEIIEFGKDGKELARTGKVYFDLVMPNYSGEHEVFI